MDHRRPRRWGQEGEEERDEERQEKKEGEVRSCATLLLLTRIQCGVKCMRLPGLE